MRRETVADKPAGGYVIVRPGQLMAAWAAYEEDKITLADLRVYLACHEIVARRCGEPGPNFNSVEIFPLCGVKRVRAAIRRLLAAGLITLEGHRLEFPGGSGKLIPFPRRMLRHLARGGGRVLIATVFGHAIRCLKLAGGKCVSGGCCPASWIAEEFGVDLRRVKSARAELVALGWLEPQLRPQWFWNRFGGLFLVCLEWPKSPPPVTGNDTALPPPDSEKEPVPENRDQEPEDAGVSIKDVQPGDLEDTARMLELHAQAAAAGVVTDSEADQLKVVAAAEHAMSVGKTNPCGLFITLLRKRLWGFITQADEDRARRRLRGYLYPAAAHVPASRPVRAPLSEDQLTVRAIKAAAARAGYRGDPFYLLKRERPEWTRERWDAASR
jgi:hypothetical protein